MELVAVRAIDFGETSFSHAVQIQDIPFVVFFFYETGL